MPLSLERDLKRYLVENPHSLESGLKLFESGGKTGEKYKTDAGLIDILAIDKNDNAVVIELKAGTADSSSFDQIVA